MTFAVIETGGKQYKVEKGSIIRIEKIAGDANSQISFSNVLLKADGGAIEVGKPYVAGAAVLGTIKRHARDDKKIIFKFHSKTRHTRMKGHRQHFTEVEITNIN